ncbi:hypothetical protein [Actinoplanes aureus]|uniref:Uncharacterized protein n=1 Tax=Actinoplanes aureus TaxID=2792083 RepID=A0A931C3Y4_9ACTN|nr:hypothetical protein [Actinoplanes aureus]MBG0561769.1 hypothetical protein [Actinoplanes aureus]
MSRRGNEAPTPTTPAPKPTNRSNHVWGNTGDTATLRTTTNNPIDTCRWTTPGRGHTTC